MANHNFSDLTRRTLARARTEAIRLEQDYVYPEHILLALLLEPDAATAALLAALDTDADRLRALVDRPRPKPWLSWSLSLPAGEIPYSRGSRTVIELAMEEARSLGATHVGTEHLLLGLLRITKGPTAEAFATAGMTIEPARAEARKALLP